MKTVIGICVLAVLWTGSTAFATTTSQIWYFHSNDKMPAPDFSVNPFGTAELHINPGPAAYPYWEVIDGRLGVWALSGEIDVIVPNNPTIRPWKEIIIDLVWAPADNDAFMPNEPLVGVSAVPMEAMEMSATDELLSGDWHHTRYDITIWPNPPQEWIAIKGDILIDEVMIRTECIPEPATMGLLGLGGLALLGVRRKA